MKKVIFSVSFLAVMLSGVANAASSLNSVVKLDDVQCIKAESLGRSNCRTQVNYGRLDYNIVATCSVGFDAILKDGTQVSRAATAVDTSDNMANKGLLTKLDADARKGRYADTAESAIEDDLLKRINKTPKCLSAAPAPAPGVLSSEGAPASAAAAN